MNFSPTQLGERIKTAREARGLSQKQLADLAGIGKTAMFDLEHGNPGVRLNTLMAVMDVLGMTFRIDDVEAVSATPQAETPPLLTDDLPDYLL
ncbi:MAG: helix-turn-helix transcriptional regulator [Verrucomicrobia bacterium]|nr:helix-turn-helix transcriptional regulator [Verrucomicrobiota bacterium]MCH8510473.1 helix-turn-helix domain-containing protein [Kiritimatiellia bacterium]